MHSGRLLDENHGKPHSRNSRWENGNHPKDKTGVAARNEMEYSRDRSSQNRNPTPRDVAHYNGKENFSDDTDIVRDYHDHDFAGRYDTSENFSYEEPETEEYWWEHWDSDGAEAGYLGENRSDWDSDYNGGSENLSEREYYDREEVCIEAYTQSDRPPGKGVECCIYLVILRARIGHFRVAVNLILKARLSAKLFIRKISFHLSSLS